MIRKLFVLCLTLLLVIPVFAEGTGITLSELDGQRIGIPSGSSFDQLIEDRFPQAELMYFGNQSDLLAALSAGKIDAFPSDEPVIRYIMTQRSDVAYIPEYLDTFDFAYCFAKTEDGQRLCGQFSEFIAGLKADGKLDELADIWFSGDESQKTLPDISALPAENGVLRMATDGDYVPFEYVRDGQVVGYDVMIAALFCQTYGYGLEIDVMNLDGVLLAVQSEKCDFGASAITITPERAESVLFSEPNFTGSTVMVVKKDEESAAPPAAGFTSVSQLNGKRIGVQAGTTFDGIVQDMLPDALITYFNSYPDMAAALTAGKIESLYFSDPYYTGGTVMAVLKAEQPAAVLNVDDSQASGSFWEGLAASFNKTFIREERWKLFLEGIGNTMLITLLSILFGTLLGFGVFMLCRNGNPIAHCVTRFSMWLVQGTPW